MDERPDFRRQLQQAEKIADRLREELLAEPGVVLVGAGAERRRGRPTGRAAIIVSVREKLSLRRLRELGRRPLPTEVEGVAVDVAVYGDRPDTVAVRREFTRALAAKDRAAQSWLALPNVTGIGVGYKDVGGELTGRVAIQLFVARKLPPAMVTELGFRLVPETIGGVPTDVIEAGPFREMVPPSGSRADRRDPLIGGLSIGHATAPFHYGTLSAIAFDASGAAVAISNEHVLDGDIGETVHQPAPVGLDDSFSFDTQLDVCMPLNFLRIDTPDTLGGSILAGAAAAVAIAAALSDEIDPFREGQDATPVSSGVLTTEEYTKVKIDFPQLPIPGTAFKLGADLAYERRTAAGTMPFGVRHDRINPHVLSYQRLFTDRLSYPSGDVVRLIGIVVPEGDERTGCDAFHCVALLRPVGLDRSYPVVLRPWSEAGFQGPSTHLALVTETFAPAAPDRQALVAFLAERGASQEDLERVAGSKREPCVYVGQFASEGMPVGKWRHWMFVQTQNTVRPGTEPLLAARTIGGLPVSNNYRSTVDVACGPLVWEDDGNFDIELL